MLYLDDLVDREEYDKLLECIEIENQDVEFKSTWKDEWLEWIC